jgi:hypothetical protein
MTTPVDLICEILEYTIQTPDELIEFLCLSKDVCMELNKRLIRFCLLLSPENITNVPAIYMHKLSNVKVVGVKTMDEVLDIIQGMPIVALNCSGNHTEGGLDPYLSHHTCNK